jgi:hypothetical protein
VPRALPFGTLGVAPAPLPKLSRGSRPGAFAKAEPPPSFLVTTPNLQLDFKGSLAQVAVPVAVEAAVVEA